MGRYRKKPVVIEASRWFRNGDHPKDNTRTVDLEDGSPTAEFRDVQAASASDA